MYRYSVKPACACTLEEKLAICKRLNITNLELGGRVDGVKIADMTPDQVENARAALIAAGVAPVSAKLSCCLCDDEAIRRWFQAAHFMGVEAVELPGERFAVGVQWHPEELTEFKEAKALFRSFVEAAAKK